MSNAGYGDAVVARLAVPPALQGGARAARLALPVPAGRGGGRGRGGPADRAGRARRAGAAVRVERLDRGGSAGARGRGPRTRRRGRCPPGVDGLWRRRRRGLPDRLGDPGHGQRADGQDDRGRGRAGGADGELHQGLLHGSGAGGPARRAGHQRAAAPGRRGRSGRRRPAAGPRHDAARRRTRRPATCAAEDKVVGHGHLGRLEPRARGVGRPWATCTAASRRRARSGCARATASAAPGRPGWPSCR